MKHFIVSWQTFLKITCSQVEHYRYSKSQWCRKHPRIGEAYLMGVVIDGALFGLTPVIKVYCNSLLFRPKNFRFNNFLCKVIFSQIDRDLYIRSKNIRCIIIFVQIIFVHFPQTKIFLQWKKWITVSTLQVSLNPATCSMHQWADLSCNMLDHPWFLKALEHSPGLWHHC